VLLVVAIVIAGCRAVPGGAAPSGGGEPASSFGEPPEACGFPPGTALEFAGRSTTAELDVQEAVGDPMSDDPADIYITRDKFDQGEHHGRLVCAVFVNQPGFVEVTVHPEDGGRVEPVDPTPRATAPPEGIARDDAIEIATGEIPDDEGWELLDAFDGPLGEMAVDPDSQPWARDLSPDLWVWNVEFIHGDRAFAVFLDYADGTVLGTAEYIVD
jgi:hypothetical protein